MPGSARGPQASGARTGARYGTDVLADARRKPQLRKQPAEPGLVVEDVETGWVGAVVRTEKSGGMRVVVLEDRRGRTRSFPLGPGFWVDGVPVELVPPAPAGPAATPPRGGLRSASGSVAVTGHRARVARASRILVEGKHDAELVEKIWGHDLRVEGVVVVPLHGVDDLAAAVEDFGPGPGRRLGVLVDHLVAGSKEWHEAASATRVPGAREHVLVVGHPFVDVWQAVRPHCIGVEAWPVVPRGLPWKEGVLEALGWPHDDVADVAEGWQRILASVNRYSDLEPALLGRVEELIDFVTGDDADR
ncbi:DUF3097 domain-containing protein [Kineosporia sp. J2-2]|uniref:DUF3097 domain-containing protein n=1 Tax=Kineosporia corallincola TaxID=2835133 RepID=A0ABS5TIA6_9ACTN|nr:DUF3097 domain-containing protein [Kineosporia corallincola]MBT0770827.1 DUF3097 domain-containing protein [Kineosporia corallincola]